MRSIGRCKKYARDKIYISIRRATFPQRCADVRQARMCRATRHSSARVERARSCYLTRDPRCANKRGFASLFGSPSMCASARRARAYARKKTLRERGWGRDAVNPGKHVEFSRPGSGHRRDPGAFVWSGEKRPGRSRYAFTWSDWRRAFNTRGKRTVVARQRRLCQDCDEKEQERHERGRKRGGNARSSI